MSRHSTRRANRRAKVYELAMFITKHEPNGCAAATLSHLITKGSRYKVDKASLGMILSPLVAKGNLRRELNIDGHAVYFWIKDLEQ